MSDGDSAWQASHPSESDWQVPIIRRPGVQRPSTPQAGARISESSEEQQGGALSAYSPPGNWEDRAEADLDSCVSWMDSGN